MKILTPLRMLLAVPLLCLTMGADKCPKPKPNETARVDRIVKSLELATTIPAFSGSVQAGLSELASAFRTVRDNPTAKNWQHALNIFEGMQSRNVFRISDPVKQAALTTIVSIVKTLLDSAAPPLPAPLATTSDNPTGRSAPDIGQIKESDVKALEDAVKKARQ